MPKKPKKNSSDPNLLDRAVVEAAQQRSAGLQKRLDELERYAANIAHDLKGPARRMAELASLLQIDYKGQLDERADRYLGWLQETGQLLMNRIEEVLKLARIGSVCDVVAWVEPEAEKGTTFFFTLPLYGDLTGVPVRHERAES